ncbi:ROK family protein [Microbacterium resistens]|uniref:ROK family protein n=1 Tax=Microbacterium resistens TaxID=156977 RepID=UPI00082C6A69|nr:ROK family protein [Microbacterium resistens]
MLQNIDELDGQAALRRVNLRRALQLVMDRPGVQTRAGIARSTGLTAATASSLVAELIDTRLIREGAPAASTGGKRATTLDVDARHHLVLVVVLRAADACLSLVRLDGSAEHEEHLAYAPADRDESLRRAIGEVAARFSGRLLAVSVQLPGATDGRVVLESVQLGWTDLPLAAQLEEQVGAPVILVNDVDAEAVAEAIAGEEPRGRRLFVHVGSGIGGAITVDRELAAGPRARVGEIGHVRVVTGAQARPCRCGGTGCLESAASLSAMLGDDVVEGRDAEDLAPLLATADDEALAHGALALGRVIILLTAMLDPVEVVIGGPVALLGDRFLDRVRAELSYVPRGASAVPVRAADARIARYAGAAQLALTAVLGVRWNPAQVLRG